MALVETLNSLTDSLTSAADSIPNLASVLPPADGNSLLDTKNELLLAYLENLAFFILLKLRQRSPEGSTDHDDEEVVQTLVKLRLHLEKGVRPLEGRLKYQLDKLLAAAGEEQSRTSGISGTAPALTNC